MVSYRDYREEDRAAVEDIIAEAFGLSGYSVPMAFAALKEADLASCMVDATFARVAVDGDTVIGAIMGSASADVTPELHSSSERNSERKMSRLRTLDFRTALNLNNMVEAYAKMLEGRTYDGFISVFALRNAYKGKGIGKHLMDELQEYQRAKGVRKAYVFTDQMCNFGFYDNRGFAKVAEGSIERRTSEKKFTYTAYLYECKY